MIIGMSFCVFYVVTLYYTRIVHVTRLRCLQTSRVRLINNLRN